MVYILYAWYIIFLPFLRGVLNWGFGQMHPLSCSHIGNPSAVEGNRIDKDTINIDQYKGFWDQRCSWTKLFFDLAKLADVNIATSKKTSFLLGKNSFARVKLTSFQAGNRHLFTTKHVRSIYCLLPSLIQRSCSQHFSKFSPNFVKCDFSTLWSFESLIKTFITGNLPFQQQTIIHLISCSFILVHWNLPEQIQNQCCI